MFSRFVTIAKLRVRSNNKPWFDDDCRRAYDTKQLAYLAGVSGV